MNLAVFTLNGSCFLILCFLIFSNFKRCTKNLQIFILCFTLSPLFIFVFRSPTGDLFVYTEIAKGLRRSGDFLYDIFTQLIYQISGNMYPLLIIIISIFILKYLLIHKKENIDFRVLLTLIIVDLIFFLPERELAQFRHAAALSLILISVYSDKRALKYLFLILAICFHLSTIVFALKLLKRKRFFDNLLLPLFILCDFFVNKSNILSEFNRTARYLAYSTDHAFVQTGNFYFLSLLLFISCFLFLKSKKFLLTERQYQLIVISYICFGLSFILRDYAIFSNRFFGAGIPFYAILIILLYKNLYKFAPLAAIAAALFLLNGIINPNPVLERIIFN